MGIGQEYRRVIRVGLREMARTARYLRWCSANSEEQVQAF